MADTEVSSMPKAKDISKLFKFIAPAFVVVCAVLKWLAVFQAATLTEIIQVGAFIYAAGAGTIDLNLFIQNIKGKE